MKRVRSAVAVGLLWVAAAAGAEGEPAGNRLVFAQVRHAGEWDPHPSVWNALVPSLRANTSLDPTPSRRVVSLEDGSAFDAPFLVLAGRGDPGLSEAALAALRRHLENGGFLLVDDTEASAGGPFDRAVRAWPARLFPGAAWRPVPRGHAFWRSFFLLKSAAGRALRTPDALGLWAGDRLVAVYSGNDLLGAAAVDPVGRPLHACVPGGEPQRVAARKMLINAVMYSVTGTYKTDAVHQPFIEKKITGAP